MALTDKLTAIAEAIRSKTGKTDPMTLEQMPAEIESIQTGGGGIEHTYTVDYIPSVNTRAFTIPIHGFSFAPSYVDCRAVTEIPNPTGLQGTVRFSVYNNFRVSDNPTAYTQGIVITKRTDGGSDYWNVFSRVTATDKEVIIDATTQNTWEFIAGVTYRFIVVEGIG